jgi:hypothetical protein
VRIHNGTHDGANVNIDVTLTGVTMSNEQTGSSGSESGNQSIGVGPGNDSHSPSQRDSGGSGGAQLTRNLEDVNSESPSTKADRADESTPPAPEAAGSAATMVNRGFQDTRSSQAGSSGTGLGAAETGGNQGVGDLAPPRK